MDNVRKFHVRTSRSEYTLTIWLDESTRRVFADLAADNLADPEHLGPLDKAHPIDMMLGEPASFENSLRKALRLLEERGEVIKAVGSRDSGP